MTYHSSNSPDCYRQRIQNIRNGVRVSSGSKQESKYNSDVDGNDYATKPC